MASLQHAQPPQKHPQCIAGPGLLTRAQWRSWHLHNLQIDYLSSNCCCNSSTDDDFVCVRLPLRNQSRCALIPMCPSYSIHGTTGTLERFSFELARSPQRQVHAHLGLVAAVARQRHVEVGAVLQACALQCEKQATRQGVGDVASSHMPGPPAPHNAPYPAERESCQCLTTLQA